jgi:hypothetical protein
MKKRKIHELLKCNDSFKIKKLHSLKFVGKKLFQYHFFDKPLTQIKKPDNLNPESFY